MKSSFATLVVSCICLAIGVHSSDVAVAPVANTSSNGGSLIGFTFPLRGGAKILFNGDFLHDKQQSSALLVYDGEHIVQAVNGSTTVIDHPSCRYAAFGGFDISHSQQGALAFTATATCKDSSSFDGVFVASPSFAHGDTVQVFSTQGSWQYGTGFTSMTSPSVAVAKDGSNLFVTYIANKANGYAAVHVSQVDTVNKKAGQSKMLVQTGDTIPESDGLTFLCISSPSINEAGLIVFFGSHCSDAGSDAINSEASKRGVFRTRHQASHSLHLGKDKVWPGIFAVSAGSDVTVVASAGTPVPGGASGATFVAFSDPALGVDGTMAFVAEGPNSLGIYARSPGEKLRLVANTETKLPSGSLIGDFPEPPSVSHGRVAFYAATGGAYTGIYLEGSQLQNSRSPEPVALLTLADTAMGAGIVYIGFGPHAYDEVTGEIAMYLVLDNAAQTDGIYTIKAPTLHDNDIPTGTDVVV